MHSTCQETYGLESTHGVIPKTYNGSPFFPPPSSGKSQRAYLAGVSGGWAGGSLPSPQLPRSARLQLAPTHPFARTGCVCVCATFLPAALLAPFALADLAEPPAGRWLRSARPAPVPTFRNAHPRLSRVCGEAEGKTRIPPARLPGFSDPLPPRGSAPRSSPQARFPLLCQEGRGNASTRGTRAPSAPGQVKSRPTFKLTAGISIPKEPGATAAFPFFFPGQPRPGLPPSLLLLLLREGAAPKSGPPAKRSRSGATPSRGSEPLSLCRGSLALSLPL